MVAKLLKSLSIGGCRKNKILNKISGLTKILGFSLNYKKENPFFSSTYTWFSSVYYDMKERTSIPLWGGEFLFLHIIKRPDSQ